MWFDISIPLNNSTPIYPSDPLYKALPHKIGGVNSRVTLNRLELSTHTGTHIDAPLHVMPNGKSITDIPLSTFIGTCYVLETKNFSLADLDSLPTDVKRVLCKANGNMPKSSLWLDNYRGMPPNFAFALSQKAPFLVGIDALSIEEKNRDILESHKIFLEKDIVILEGIDLSEVEQGYYELFATPLRLENLDGSPVRAVLKKIV